MKHIRVYMCMAIDECGEEWLAKATIDLNAARKFCRDYIEEKFKGDRKIVEDWEKEFESYVPRGANAESVFLICRVIDVDEH